MPRAATKKKTPTLRDRHSDETRKVILDAMVEQLVDTGAFEFSMFELARRANVSARTIYRHFPTRESLFDALSERVNEQIGFHDYPTTLLGAQQLVRQLFPSFDRNRQLVLAQMETRKGREFRSHARQGRTAAMTKVVSDLAPHAEERLRKSCIAAISCLMSSDAWLRLSLSLNMDGQEAGEAVAWAIGALGEQLLLAEKAAVKGRGSDPAALKGRESDPNRTKRSKR